MKRHRLLALIVFIVVVTAAASWWWKYGSLRPDRSDDRLVLFGNADIREVELAFNGSDRINELLVEEGDRVEANQVVGRLDTHRLDPEVRRAEARLEAQRQVLIRLEAGSRPQEIRRAEATAEEAAARLRDAEENHQEVKAAFDQNAANVREMELAQTSLDVAHAAHQVALETLGLIRAGPREEEIAEARATLNVYEAELDLARQRLNDAELRSPCDGVVRDRLLEPGDMANPTRPVLTVALIDPIWIRAYVDEPDLGRLRLGMKATVTTDTFPDKVYAGWVGYISPTAEFTPKTVESRRVRTSLVYELRVHVRNPEGELRLGMPATVTLTLAMTRPASASDADP